MNLLPLVSGLSIASKRHGVIPLTPNNAQRRILREVGRAYDERRPARLIILKSRQVGISTVSEAILFAWAIRFASTNCVVAAHDLESSMMLFQMTRMFYESFEYRDLFPTRFASQNRLMFKTNRSGIYVVTASRKSAGRGRTIHALHASEMALYGHPEETWLSFRQAVPDTPGSIIIIESTAAGMGNLFEQTWNEAKAGNNEYVPLFFPWFKHHEYIPCFGETCRDATCITCQQWGKGVRPRNSAEQDLAKLGCKPPQLAWRRWAVENRCFGSTDLFQQEFP